MKGIKRKMAAFLAFSLVASSLSMSGFAKTNGRQTEKKLELSAESMEIEVDESQELSVTGPQGLTNIQFTVATGSNAVKVEKTADSAKATVTGLSEGKATIVVTATKLEEVSTPSEASPSETAVAYRGECIITVGPKTEPEPEPEPDGDKVSSIKVSFNSNEDEDYYVSQMITASAVVTPVTASSSIAWKAEGTASFEKVDETPLENGIANATYIASKEGTLKVSASADGKSNSSTITIKPIKTEASFEETAVQMAVGSEMNFKDLLLVELLKPTTGENLEDLAESAKDSAVFESSVPEVLKIGQEDGIASALKEGRAIVSATVPGSSKAAKCVVTIADNNSYIIQFDTEALIMSDTGKIRKLGYKIFQVTEEGTVEVNSEDLKLVWSSSNEKIAAVDSIGMVSSVAAGEAVITLSIQNKEEQVLAQQICAVTVEEVVAADVDTATSYREDIQNVLDGNVEEISKADGENAAVVISGSIEQVGVAQIIKNPEAAKEVMNDVRKIEAVLKNNGSADAKAPDVASKAFTGEDVDVDGLILNAFLVGDNIQPQLVIQDIPADTVNVPAAVGGKSIEADSAIIVDIDVPALSGSLSAPVRIKLPVPAGFSADKMHILHYEEAQNGDKDSSTVVPFYVEDGKIVMTLESFSPFAFVKVQGAPTPDKPEVPDRPTSSSSSSGGGSSIKKSPAGTWQMNAVGWWYRYNDGTWPVNCWAYLDNGNTNYWFHFDQEGYMQTGWFTDINGKIYYLNPVSDGTRGSMKTGWQAIDGKWYYFNPTSDGYKGAMYQNTTTPDGYTVGADGALIQ